jgi:hypothetical protein
MSLIAYVRYDNKGRIVPGGPIVTSVKPKVGDWVALEDVLVTATPSNYKLRAFVRYINKIGGQRNGNKYVAGSMILQQDAPQDGNWKEVYVLNPACCATTTTTTSSTSTTTTTTTIPPPVIYYYNVTGYSCGTPCNNVGPFTAQSTTPLTIGYFYNNPENRGYTFEILEEIAPTLGGYDLTGEPGYETCVDACP